MINANKKRLRRTMMFLNAQKPGLIKDPYIYRPDSIMLDLEDAVAENQKDAARFSLYHALKEINYRGCERVVRINGLDTHTEEDIHCAVAGGCDAIPYPQDRKRTGCTESGDRCRRVRKEVRYPGRPHTDHGSNRVCKRCYESLDICEASERLFGIALSGGDYTKDLQTHITGTGLD